VCSNDLQRFHLAQEDAQQGYPAALDEIRTTGKRTHWIWYVFPQLAGLGQSAEARRYGIAGRAEARVYLEDPVLRARLLEITAAVAYRLLDGVSLLELMGSAIDAVKLVSSLTLFGLISREMANAGFGVEFSALATVAERVLLAAAKQGYPRCPLTLRQLNQAPTPS
jgi:uncharacterized protein (DUF1810 family)